MSMISKQIDDLRAYAKDRKESFQRRTWNGLQDITTAVGFHAARGCRN